MILWLRNVVAVGAILLASPALEAQIVTDNALPLPAMDRAKVQALIDAADASARVKAILKDRYEAARTEMEERYKEYFAGRGSLDFLLETSRRLLDAEIDVCVKKADRVAAWEAHRERLQRLYLANKERYDVGRVPFKDVMESLFYRVEADLELEREGQPAQPVVGLDWARLPADLPSVPGDTVRSWLAKSPGSELRRSLLKTRIVAAYEEIISRWGEFQAGRGGLNIFLEASRRVLDAECDLSSRAADRIAALDAHWRRTAGIEKLVQERYEIGRVPGQDLAWAKYARLDAEIKLERAKKGAADQLKRLLKARAEAAEAEVTLRRVEFLRGRGTLDIFLDANKRWLRAVEEMGDEPAHRVAALGAYRRRMAEIERGVQGWYDTGKIPIQDLAEVRYYRAEADLWLERAKTP